MKFSENDIKKWKELKESLYNDGYTMRDIGSYNGVFYSKYDDDVYFSIEYDNCIDLTTDTPTQSMLDVLDFLIEKRSQLEKVIPLKCAISPIVDVLNDAVLKLDEKFNKNLTISNDQKVGEIGDGDDENDDEKHEQSHEKSGDMVNHPEHYNTGSVECIDLMIELFGVEAVKGFCLCNSFKYLYRNMNKNGLEDIKKSVWYQKKYLELTEQK